MYAANQARHERSPGKISLKVEHLRSEQQLCR